MISGRLQIIASQLQIIACQLQMIASKLQNILLSIKSDKILSKCRNFVQLHLQLKAGYESEITKNPYYSYFNINY